MLARATLNVLKRLNRDEVLLILLQVTFWSGVEPPGTVDEFLAYIRKMAEMEQLTVTNSWDVMVSG